MKLKLATEKQAKDTGMAMTLIFLVLFLFFDIKFFVVASVLSILMTMVFPIFFKIIAIFWFGFSSILGSVMSKVLLTVLFFIIVTPVACIRRFFGADSMGAKKWKDNNDSVFEDRNMDFTKVDLEKPF